MRLLPLIAVVLLVGCGIKPSGSVVVPKMDMGGSADATQYACTDAHPGCPDGLSCLEGCCGTNERAGTCSATSPLYEAGVDGGIPNPVFGPAAGCATGMGYTFLADKSYGCVGAFTDGAWKQCAAGFNVCTVSEGAQRYSPVLPNFFASAQPMELYGEYPRCGYTLPGLSEHYVAGVGGNGKGYVMPLLTPCAGWKTIVRIDPPGTGGWVVPLSSPPTSADVEHISNSNADDGVLCCGKFWE